MEMLILTGRYVLCKKYMPKDNFSASLNYSNKKVRSHWLLLMEDMMKEEGSMIILNLLYGSNTPSTIPAYVTKSKRG
jgi:hypothetical protein